MSKKKNKQQETVVEPPAQSPTTPQPQLLPDAPIKEVFNGLMETASLPPSSYEAYEELAGWVFEENRATLRHVLDGVA